MQTFVTADRRRMYDDLAWAWPIISPPEDCVGEAEEAARLIQAHARIPVRRVLNLGCGGGHNDFTLKNSFDLTGVDISDDMLALARHLNPEVEYVAGDMRSVRLGREFDAVVIFDSINYMRTLDSLGAAFKTACSHLKPGGVMLTCAERTRESFQQNLTLNSTHKRGEIEITLVKNYYDPDPDDNWYEANFVYLIRRSGELTIEADCHLLGLFSQSEWLDLMRGWGCDIRQITSPKFTLNGRPFPILIGVKPE